MRWYVGLEIMPGVCLLLVFESSERGINCESIAKDNCCLNAPDCCEGVTPSGQLPFSFGPAQLVQLIVSQL
ncbi:uncharacterized protein BKA55DRAFT_305275 [Fusarium redolens]|uniref:Hydrophobin n=1 Tax=Fusarium redolens TaxID=48865 RepID=A0A9P9HLB9_FUSRE|nr:uncharacterized protein BKA55DRAFT_305275 [Fusarium redolens]KAH7259729.1 hypothetical protein BKA55DRAFT_305275 [Fusarium redolens]